MLLSKMKATMLLGPAALEALKFVVLAAPGAVTWLLIGILQIGHYSGHFSDEESEVVILRSDDLC